MAEIKIQNITKSFLNPDMSRGLFPLLSLLWKNVTRGKNDPSVTEETIAVLKDVSLDIPDGKTLALLGPSGSGKTTLLRIIAGLEYPDSGTILFNGNDVRELRPAERKIGLVFQNYALYPHLTAKENMTTFYLFKTRTGDINREKEKRFRQTSEILGVEIKKLIQKKPPTLSDGERQKVAVGRCITREPNIFLMDEPFANIDTNVRESYRIKLKKLLQQLQTTTVYVTHDQHEAMMLGDIIAIMRNGSIEQCGAFDEIYNTPVNMFVADFISLFPGIHPVNFFDGHRYSREYRGYTVGVRCEDTAIHTSSATSSPEVIQGRVTMVNHIYSSQESMILVETSLGELSSRMPLNPEISEDMSVTVSFGRKYLFDPDTTLRLYTVDEQQREIASGL